MQQDFTRFPDTFGFPPIEGGAEDLNNHPLFQPYLTILQAGPLKPGVGYVKEMFAQDKDVHEDLDVEIKYRAAVRRVLGLPHVDPGLLHAAAFEIMVEDHKAGVLTEDLTEIDTIVNNVNTESKDFIRFSKFDKKARLHAAQNINLSFRVNKVLVCGLTDTNDWVSEYIRVETDRLQEEESSGPLSLEENASLFYSMNLGLHVRAVIHASYPTFLENRDTMTREEFSQWLQSEIRRRAIADEALAELHKMLGLDISLPGQPEDSMTPDQQAAEDAYNKDMEEAMERFIEEHEDEWPFGPQKDEKPQS